MTVNGGIALGSIRLQGHPCQRDFVLNRKSGSEMQKVIHRAQKSNFPSMGFSGAALAIIPIFAIFYILLILPFFPDDGKGRVENILFWPVAAVLTLTLVFQNWARIDSRFFRSLPIASSDRLFCIRGRKRDMGLCPGLCLQSAFRGGAGVHRCRCPIRSAHPCEIHDSKRASLLRHRVCHQRCLCPDDTAVSNRSSRIFHPQAGAGHARRGRHYLVEL